MLSACLLSILKQMDLLLKECCFNMSMASTKVARLLIWKNIPARKAVSEINGLCAASGQTPSLQESLGA